MEDGSAVSILRGASCRDVASSLVVAAVLMSINGKMKRRSGFGIIIAKTMGMCYRHKLTGAASELGLKQGLKKA